MQESPFFFPKSFDRPTVRRLRSKPSLLKKRPTANARNAKRYKLAFDPATGHGCHNHEEHFKASMYWRQGDFVLIEFVDLSEPTNRPDHTARGACHQD